MRIGILSVMMALSGSSLVAQEPPKDAKEIVKGAVEKLSAAGNYTFVYKPEVDTGDGDLGRFADAFRQGVEGAVDTKTGLLRVRGGEAELIRKGDRIAILGPNGWTAPEEGNRPRRREGGQEGDRERGRGRMTGMRLARVGAPHEEGLKTLESCPTLSLREDPERVGEINCTVYEGAMTEAGVRALILRPLGRFAERAQAEVADAKGEVRFLVDPQGALLRYEVSYEGLLSMDVQGAVQEWEMKGKMTTELSKVGSTVVEIPEEAKAILEKEALPKEEKPPEKE